MARNSVLCGVAAMCLTVACPPYVFAGGAVERRGEIGVQVGVRMADNDIRPAGDNGLAFAYGSEGAWAFDRKWALFWDVNALGHDSRESCSDNPNCNALTPIADATGR